MIEVNFKDRVPTHPGRIKLTPVQGQENTFDMERVDEPIEIGTPLDKASIDSIIKSRLTGRYYVPAVKRTELSNITTSANPIPASGWLNVSRTSASLNGYELFSSPASVQSDNITAAFDGNDSTYWLAPAQVGESYIGFKLPSVMTVTKVKVKVGFSGASNYCIIQASNDGITWDSVSTQMLLGASNTAVEIELTTNKPYFYYRIKFVDVPTDYGIFCYSFEIAQSTVITMRNEFTIEAFPTDRTDYQRFTIITPDYVNTVGVVNNTLNGQNIDTILQPNKYYELIKIVDRFYAFGK